MGNIKHRVLCAKKLGSRLRFFPFFVLQFNIEKKISNLGLKINVTDT